VSTREVAVLAHVPTPIKIKAVNIAAVNILILRISILLLIPVKVAAYAAVLAFCKLVRKNICPFWGLATIGIGLPIKQTLRFWSSDSHYVGDGQIVYRRACQLGCEGTVSKRLGLPYRSGRSKHWVKVKNPAAPAVRREGEEEWR
jgi:hypothetical protein